MNDGTAEMRTVPATTPCAVGEVIHAPRPLPLRDARDAKRLLARIINEVRTGTLDPRRASVIIYGTNIFLSSIAAAEMEQRIQALEDGNYFSR